ncbi:MAG: hypothetical protein ACRDAP_15535, partial [Shewanella sp.]
MVASAMPTIVTPALATKVTTVPKLTAANIWSRADVSPAAKAGAEAATMITGIAFLIIDISTSQEINYFFRYTDSEARKPTEN